MALYNANIATDVDVFDQLWPNCKKDEQEPCILESEVKAATAKIKIRYVKLPLLIALRAS